MFEWVLRHPFLEVGMLVRTLPAILLLPILLGACRRSPTAPDPGEMPTPVDCVGQACPELLVPGDPYQENPDFHGYADPSIRKDPVSPTIWLSYSFPHYKILGGSPVPSVAIHLARSGDGGRTWSFVKRLFQPEAMANPANPAQPGFLDHETINLAPVARGGARFWAAARLNYFIPAMGGFGARPNNSFHISIVTAPTPDALTTGMTARLAGGLTHAAWNADQVLVPPDLASAAFFWNEPALHYDVALDRLYLVMVAFVYQGGVPLMERNDVYVYSTTPAGAPESWTWSYRGKLVDGAVAAELGGERVTQTDIAVARDGRLLLILTPDDWHTTQRDFIHKGGMAVEIRSLETPALERDGQGRLRIRAVWAASDANALGSGASAYDPHSETGVLFTRRVKLPASLTASIHSTFIHP